MKWLSRSREVSALRETVSLSGQETPLHIDKLPSVSLSGQETPLHIDKLPCPAPLEKSGISNQQLVGNDRKAIDSRDFFDDVL